METFLEIQDWVLNEADNDSAEARTRVKRYINTILTEQYLGTRYSWNLNATTWSIASGASTIDLPSQMGHYDLTQTENITYGNMLKPVSRRQFKMYETGSGILEICYRQGTKLVFTPVTGTQQIDFEWFPQYAELTASDDVPLCPHKQVIAEGALALFLERNKDERMGNQWQKFFSMRQEIQETDKQDLINIEDQENQFQDG